MLPPAMGKTRTLLLLWSVFVQQIFLLLELFTYILNIERELEEICVCGVGEGGGGERH